MTLKQALVVGAVVGSLGTVAGLALLNQPVRADTMINAQSSNASVLWGSIRPLSDGGYVCNLHLQVPESFPDGGVMTRTEDVAVEPCANACMPSVLSRAQGLLPY